MSTQILKEYSQRELENLCKDYKYVGVQDVNGNKIQPFNQYGVNVKDHLKKCFKRMESEAVPVGYYYFCFSNSPRQSQNPDKFIFKKGNVSQDMLSDNSKHFFVQNGNTKQDLLSVQSALGYITQIAELKTENNRLAMENKALIDENTVLKAELEEAERSAEAEEGLSDKGGMNGVGEFLKDQSPALMGIAERFFDLQEKKLDYLTKRDLSRPKQNPASKKRILKMEIGSEQHLDLIRKLYNAGNDEKMNKELDKLEEKNPEAYQAILTELNLNEEGGEEHEE